MRRAVLLADRRAGFVQVPKPEPKEDWVLVKVHAAPLCTEYKTFLAGRKAEFLGHEAAGEVVALDQPGRVRVGDRVVVMPQFPCGTCSLCIAGEYIHCQSNHDFAQVHGTLEGSATLAQYLLKPSWLLPRIPEGVPYERASLACCGLGPSFGAFEAMGISAFDSILITGAGPVGLGAVVNARYRGARVIVVESAPWRVERARQMGAAGVLDPADSAALEKIRDQTDGRGVDAALECSGNVQAARLCIDAVRPKGKVAFVGQSFDELPMRISADLLSRGLTLIGSWHYNLRHFPAVMQVIQRSPLIDLLVSHVMPMSAFQEALELCASRQAAKIVLKPWD